ncbi:tropomyosin-like [Gigantopelta aegis]|uniref:tropomyosin-like n=1 Tax=Gigantopelta aegis TaxID=1735272 RepID=UPI001B887D96|nr:tropomyosin-like [Gigantopelta aegis]
MSAGTTEILKSLQNKLQDVSRLSKTLQDSAKKLDNAKKEKDSNTVKDSLQKQLQQSTLLFDQIQEKIHTLQEQLAGDQDALPSTKKDQSSSKTDESSEKKSPTKAKLTPEEQEIAYEHKAQMMRNLEGPNRNLQTELILQERMNEVKHLNHQNRKLHEECKLSQINAMKLVQKFERKAKEMDNKIKAMEQELIKSGQLAQRYKDMYMQERQKNREKQQDDRKNESADKEMVDANETEKTTIIMTQPGSDSFMGSSVRVNDVIRRNEHLVEQNAALRREIDRLKHDNAELLKKAKHAMENAHDLMQHLNTSEMAKADLLKKFNHERAQHNQLKKSLNKQASDWISSKREQQQLQEDIRFRLISPITPYGGCPSNTYQSNKMQYESRA